jgi:antitoxin (DNA-binding transcriptional repressor) of toxin-antitoxin stability system
MHTGKLVRAAASEKIIITNRGKVVAVLTRPDEPDLVGKPFPERDIQKMPEK